MRYPEKITTEQLTAAVTALGLDPSGVTEITIEPHTVTVTFVDRDENGKRHIPDGEAKYPRTIRVYDTHKGDRA